VQVPEFRRRSEFVETDLSIWLTGGPMERLAQIAEAVAATETARIATGIIPVAISTPSSMAAH